MASSAEPSNLAIVSNEEVRRRQGRVDLHRVRATAPAEIERQKAEDDYPSPDQLGPARRGAGGGPDVSALRLKLRLSPEDFAVRFGLSLRTVQQWEQQSRAPDGPAQQLLRIIAEDPNAVAEIVSRLAHQR
jgi:putative transcriptional regulator